jgi:drug/metabolite transporter (DMT)-like permease
MPLMDLLLKPGVQTISNLNASTAPLRYQPSLSPAQSISPNAAQSISPMPMMSLLLRRFQGPLLMVLATASFVTNDTLMKLATAGLPPYEVLLLRGLWATFWAVPLFQALQLRRQIPLIFHKSVLLRNGLELLAIMSFIVALANMPIADVTALGQVTPLLVLLGASFLFGEKLGWAKGTLVGLGLIGALMVAQPTSDGISVYALMALATAAFGACRDLSSRRVPLEVPGLLVALGASLIVLIGASVAHLAFEDWTTPTWRHLLLLSAAGLFLFGGHFFIFMAYRIGPSTTVAPFYYLFTFWAVFSGLLVFGVVPNRLALAGIGLVIASGIAVVLLDQRQARPEPVA